LAFSESFYLLKLKLFLFFSTFSFFPLTNLVKLVGDTPIEDDEDLLEHSASEICFYGISTLYMCFVKGNLGLEVEILGSISIKFYIFFEGILMIGCCSSTSILIGCY